MDERNSGLDFQIRQTVLVLIKDSIAFGDVMMVASGFTARQDELSILSLDDFLFRGWLGFDEQYIALSILFWFGFFHFLTPDLVIFFAVTPGSVTPCFNKALISNNFGSSLTQEG